jgi:hypothetical protein
MERVNELSPIDSLDPLSVGLPTESLQCAWEKSLENIIQARTEQAILEHVSIARGFAWGVYAGALVDHTGFTSMGAKIILAHQEALDKRRNTIIESDDWSSVEFMHGCE